MYSKKANRQPQILNGCRSFPKINSEQRQNMYNRLQHTHLELIFVQWEIKSTAVGYANETTKQSYILQGLPKQSNKHPQQERNAATVAIPWAWNRDPVDLVAGARGRPGEGGTETRASRSASSSHPTRKSRSAQQQQLAGGWQEVKTGE